MEELNAWASTASSWVTLITAAGTVVKWLAPKIRESFKMWRRYKRKR